MHGVDEAAQIVVRIVFQLRDDDGASVRKLFGLGVLRFRGREARLQIANGFLQV